MRFEFSLDILLLLRHFGVEQRGFHWREQTGFCVAKTCCLTFAA